MRVVKNKMVKPLPTIQLPMPTSILRVRAGGGWCHERTAVLDGPGVVVHVAINSYST